MRKTTNTAYVNSYGIHSIDVAYSRNMIFTQLNDNAQISNVSSFSSSGTSVKILGPIYLIDSRSYQIILIDETL